VALVLASLVLYGSGLSWGIPHATAPDRDNSWGVDDGTPLEPLAEMHNIVAPSPDRNLGYPLMHPFMVSAAYAPYLAYLWATGGLATVSGVYPYGLTDPVRALAVLSLIAHALSTVLGAGLVLAVYLAGRRLWDRPTGVVAALFAMTSFPMFYYTRTGNVDALRLDLAVHDEQRGGTQERSRTQGIEGNRGVQRPAGAPVLPIR
jgi:hypothetical protein